MRAAAWVRGLLLAAGLYPGLSAGAPGAVFTTAALARDGRVFVSSVARRPGWEPRSGLFAIDPGTWRRRPIPVPDDLSTRELWALIPLEGGRLLVVSQQTPEGGDAPQVHQVDPRTGTWAPLARLPACVSVMEIRIERARLVFRCEGDGEGPPREASVALPGDGAPAPGRVAPKAAEARVGAFRIRLTGLPFAWEGLEVVRHRAVRRFRP